VGNGEWVLSVPCIIYETRLGSEGFGFIIDPKTNSANFVCLVCT
jgi:hypothetical protein